MRLTGLLVQGFKSFADRTSLEFSEQVTAIVGPNGSGKSNVVDALRWATGGGRAREFRADDKADLIFHGASYKRPLGYAEVEVELAGVGGTVKILRTLFKDGETKLRLNGKAARFVDIEDVLSGSGLGRGGLALIGQGEVSQVLMADPVRLLGYVAEAAGAARLGGRRDQAQARLASTQEHLVRLRDISVEMERQLEQLAQEAEQAHRASELAREIRVLRFSLSRARHESLSREVEGLERARAEAQAQLEQSGVEHDEAQTRWRALRDALAAAETCYRERLAEFEARRGDHRVAVERHSSAKRHEDSIRREAELLAAEVEHLTAAKPPVPPEGDAASLQERVERLANELEKARARAQGTTEELEKARERLSRARRKREEQEASRRRRHQERASLATEADAIRERLSGIEAPEPQEIRRLEDDAAECRRRFQELKVTLTESRHAADEARSHEARLAAEATSLAGHAKRQSDALETRRGYAKGPQVALSSGIPGVIGSVADLLQVPDKYMVAVAAALGRRLEHVVVTDADVAQQVLDVVRSRGGWVTLLPLDLIHEPHEPAFGQLLAEPGVIAPAFDLVEVEPRFTPLARQFLANVVLVEDMNTAVRIARRHRRRPRLVTVDGSLLESSGAMAGGRRASGVDLLGLASEAERAQAVAIEAQAKATDASVQASQLAAEVTALDEQLEGAERRSAAALQALATVRQQQASAEARRVELTSQLAGLKEKLAALDTQESAHQEPLDADEEELVNNVQRATQAAEAARCDVDRIQGAHGEARQGLAIYEERLSSHRRATEAYNQGQARLDSVRDRLRELEFLVKEASTATSNAHGSAVAAEAAVPTDLDQVEAAYQSLAKETAEAEATLEKLAAGHAQASARFEELVVALTRREAALEAAAAELREYPEGTDWIEGSTRQLRDRLTSCERELEELGPVNHRAAQDHAVSKSRHDEMRTQIEDAEAAAAELEAVLGDLDRETNERLTHAAGLLERGFAAYVQELFGGDARAGIELLREDGRPTGLNISLTPPGKETKSLALLSVGERTMGALAFLFALIGEVSTENGGISIAILDEVDAPLDEANIRRFTAFLTRLASSGTQFVLITHQKATMEVADVLWGVTTEHGVSRVFSISREQHAALA